MNRRDGDIAALNHIAQILIDARRLYARAARLTSSTEAIADLEMTMGERAHLVDMIQDQVAGLGGAPQTEGSLLGAAHMRFFDVRVMFNRDEAAAIAEVERSETYLCDEVRKCMRQERISAETRAFLGIVLDRITSTGFHAARADQGNGHEHRL